MSTDMTPERLDEWAGCMEEWARQNRENPPFGSASYAAKCDDFAAFLLAQAEAMREAHDPVCCSLDWNDDGSIRCPLCSTDPCRCSQKEPAPDVQETLAMLASPNGRACGLEVDRRGEPVYAWAVAQGKMWPDGTDLWLLDKEDVHTLRALAKRVEELEKENARILAVTESGGAIMQREIAALRAELERYEKALRDELEVAPMSEAKKYKTDEGKNAPDAAQEGG